MILNMNEYINMINNLKISIIYSGPMWEDGIKGISDVVRSHLDGADDLPNNVAKTIFSVFIEQVTNMLLYSSEKVNYAIDENADADVTSGMLVLGHKGNTYFIQTRNAIEKGNTAFIKEKIDYLNTLDKKELRQYHKEQMRIESNNPESKGAGLGLIEIARRTTAPIGYEFESSDNGLTYFTMYVEIAQEME